MQITAILQTVARFSSLFEMSSEAREFEQVIADNGSSAEVTLRGAISERVELSTSVPKGVPIFIDAGAVTKINSLGVRTWIRFLEALCANTPDVIIRRMSPVLVLQASMIGAFMSRTRVESFLSPWCCTSCSSSHQMLHGIHDEIPESMSCKQCGASMEFDSDPDMYEAFKQMCEELSAPSLVNSQLPQAL